MPRIFDMSAIDWPEDDDDFYPKPKPSEFEYMPPYVAGGRPEPVRFSLADATVAGRSRIDDSLEQPRQTKSNALVIVLRAFGMRSRPETPDASQTNWRRERDEREAADTRRLFDHVLPLFVRRP